MGQRLTVGPEPSLLKSCIWPVPGQPLPCQGPREASLGPEAAGPLNPAHHELEA